MKILLIGNGQSYLAKRLEQEAKASPDHFEAINLTKLIIDYRAGHMTLLGAKGRDLSDFDCYYFYGVGRRQGVAGEIARALSQQGKKVVEPALTNGSLPDDKLQLHNQGSLHTVPYRYYFKLSLKKMNSLKFPLIAKKVGDSCGRLVSKINDKEEMISYVAANGKDLIIQDYIDIKFDYRVLVVGDRALGVMKRIAPDNQFLTTKPGGQRESANLNHEILEQCIQAVKYKGLSIAGVDLVEHNGQYQLFEINSSPQIRIFEKVTGINAAGIILKHLSNT